MQRAGCTVFMFLLTFAPLAAASEAQEISLEVLSDGPLAPCTEVHKPNCEVIHTDDPGDLSPGSLLWLDGRPYVLLWMGPGYYLESGVILEPLGEALPGLKSQRWREVYPNDGAIHFSFSWQDMDRNRALSVSDTLALEPGQALKVKDVRLRLRVKPAEP